MFGRFFRGLGRALAALWHGLDVLRRALLNLAVLALLVLALVLLLRAAPSVPQGAALVLRPEGALVEATALDDSLQTLGVTARNRETVLHDLVEGLRAAREDKRIAALVLETDQLEPSGLAKLAELRDAIADFRASGKPVLARGEHFTQGEYYLASVADEVDLAPDGYLLLNGLSRYVTYFKGALDKLGVKVHVFRVGEYKSFSEPFTRTDMSPQDREASRDLLQGLWRVAREDVIRSRHLEAAAFDRYVDAFPAVLAAAAGDTAKAALDAKLVDRLSTRDEWRERLQAKVGKSADGKSFRHIDFADYLADARARRTRANDRVAVIVAQGAIVDGVSPPGGVGGDTLARLIRAARENDRVKAVVLRIDSPGGSAFASEVIRRELELTREKGKPVVASMSAVAASGGYWIAAGADEIWAAPTTITGSIGIFAILPELTGPLERLGISVDGVATGPLADALDPRRPLDPAAAAALQQAVEHGYRRFLATVAKARHMSTEDVDRVARGRVWTGAAAAELGLVDHLGGLEAAVAAAARRAGLEHYEVVWPQPQLSLPRRLLELAERNGAVAQVVAWARPAPMPDSPLGRVVAGLQAEAAGLLTWNDPRHLYAHCLCEAP